MTDTTPAAIGADAERQAFGAWAQIEYRDAAKYTRRDYELGLAAWRAALASAAAPKAAPAQPTHPDALRLAHALDGGKRCLAGRGHSVLD